MGFVGGLGGVAKELRMKDATYFECDKTPLEFLYRLVDVVSGWPEDLPRSSIVSTLKGFFRDAAVFSTSMSAAYEYLQQFNKYLQPLKEDLKRSAI